MFQKDHFTILYIYTVYLKINTKRAHKQYTPVRPSRPCLPCFQFYWQSTFVLLETW